MNRFVLPLFGFVALIGLLAVGLHLDPHKVPSPLIDKPAPAFDVPQLRDPQARLTTHTLQGHVAVLNVWASWCGGCRSEHPLLMNLAATHKNLNLYGLDYKDTNADARAVLDRHGDPYAAVGVDPEGKVGLDYGVYGVPETYVIDRRGVIRYKHIGPLSADILQERILPLIESLEHEQI